MNKIKYHKKFYYNRTMQLEKEHVDNVHNNNNTPTVVSDNYVIMKKIGSGSFGEVYLAQHKKTGGYVAAKVEDRMKPARIINEYKIYKYLAKTGFAVGLPKIYEYMQGSDYNFLFMQLLGPSLEDLFVKYNKKLKLETVFCLALQLIELMELMHRANFIHRDIKPNNFLIGRDTKDQIYMIDPGLSKKYMVEGKHMKYRDNRSLIGTARYASLNMHIGIEPSRRDDLESIGYMLVYFAKGSLPWQGLRKKKGVNNIEVIGETKMCTNVSTLCSGLPDCFAKYITYCRDLKFDGDPDYAHMKELFNSTIKEMKITPKFEWI
jgi:serine/threonine protein kinase